MLHSRIAATSVTVTCLLTVAGLGAIAGHAANIPEIAFESLEEGKAKGMQDLATASRLWGGTISDAGVFGHLEKLQSLTEEHSGSYLPAAEDSVLEDVAFRRYVSADLLTRAVGHSELEAPNMIDVALQLTHGERILLRPHRIISARALMELALQIATKNGDEESLRRIKRVAETLEDDNLAAEAEAALQLPAESRSSASQLLVDASTTTPELYGLMKGLTEEIERAMLLKDAEALVEIASRIDVIKGITPKQRASLAEMVEEATLSIPEDLSESQRALQRLATNSRADVSSCPRVRMDILVGGVLKTPIRHQGKLYIPVRELGVEYTILIQNLGSRRILAVVSVDGLSVMNGQVATEYSNGYVIAPGKYCNIRGWRRGSQEVAAFTFTDVSESYAEQSGRPQRIGLIRLVAVEEEPQIVVAPTMPHQLPWHTPGAAGGVFGGSFSVPTMSTGAGTGYGRRVEDHVRTVQFTRSDRKSYTEFIYNTVDELRKAGVPVGLAPGGGGGDSFTPPPPGWGMR